MATNVKIAGSQKRRSKNGPLSNMTSPLRHPAATLDFHDSPRPNEVKPTVQSKEIVLYCHLCERNFVNENGMRMHLATSKDHKKKVAMQELSTHAQDLKLAALLTPGTLASTILYGHLNHTQNTLATLTYGSTEVGGYNHIPGMMGISSLYGQAGNAIKFPSQTSTELALISTDLPQPDQILNKIGTAQENSSSQKADLKHENLVPTVIPSSQQSAELESLSGHCHASEDLLKNKYLLCLYTADNIAGLSRCQNCGGDYWAVIYLLESHLTDYRFTEESTNSIPPQLLLSFQTAASRYCLLRSRVVSDRPGFVDFERWPKVLPLLWREEGSGLCLSSCARIWEPRPYSRSQIPRTFSRPCWL